jgi:hypothetical protein
MRARIERGDYQCTGESAVLNTLGLAYFDQGRFAAAIDCLEQSLAICSMSQNLPREPDGFQYLSDTRAMRGVQ